MNCTVYDRIVLHVANPTVMFGTETVVCHILYHIGLDFGHKIGHTNSKDTNS